MPRQEAQSRRRGLFRKDEVHLSTQVGERGTDRRGGTAEGPGSESGGESRAWILPSVGQQAGWEEVP